MRGSHTQLSHNDLRVKLSQYNLGHTPPRRQPTLAKRFIHTLRLRSRQSSHRRAHIEPFRLHCSLESDKTATRGSRSLALLRCPLSTYPIPIPSLPGVHATSHRALDTWLVATLCPVYRCPRLPTPVEHLTRSRSARSWPTPPPPYLARQHAAHMHASHARHPLNSHTRAHLHCRRRPHSCMHAWTSMVRIGQGGASLLPLRRRTR